MVEYRLLTKDDGDAYFDVLHRSYATDRPYPLSFDAMDETREEAIQWLQEEPTFGLFVDHKLVSAIPCGCLGGTILAPLVCPILDTSLRIPMRRIKETPLNSFIM